MFAKPLGWYVGMTGMRPLECLQVPNKAISMICRDATSTTDDTPPVWCHHCSMTVPGSEMGLKLNSAWIDDLRWHRDQYRQSRFQWTSSDALLAATEFTRGRQSFTTLSELRELSQARRSAAAYATVCQRAFGEAARHARRGLETTTSWSAVARELDTTVVTCSASSHFSIWSQAHERTNPQVARVQKIVDGLYFSNPLIRAWELKQLWDLYAAAEDILEDTLVDLAVELDGFRRADAIAQAADVRTVAGLGHRIKAQRAQRGAIGDPRRTPHQYS